MGMIGRLALTVALVAGPSSSSWALSVPQADERTDVIQWRGTLTAQIRYTYRRVFESTMVQTKQVSGRATLTSFNPAYSFPVFDNTQFQVFPSLDGAGYTHHVERYPGGCFDGVLMDWSTVDPLGPWISLITPDQYAGNADYAGETQPLLSWREVFTAGTANSYWCDDLVHSEYRMELLKFVPPEISRGLHLDGVRLNDSDPDPDRILGETRIEMGDDGRWATYYKPDWWSLGEGCTEGNFCLTEYSLTYSYDLTRTLPASSPAPSAVQPSATAPVQTPATAPQTPNINPLPTVRVKAVSAKSRLFVDVNPNKGAGYWTFKVQYKKKDGTNWGTYKKTYKTRTSKETRTLDFKEGTYRVVVKAKYGYLGTTSAEVYLKR